MTLKFWLLFGALIAVLALLILLFTVYRERSEKLKTAREIRSGGYSDFEATQRFEREGGIVTERKKRGKLPHKSVDWIAVMNVIGILALTGIFAALTVLVALEGRL
jgi:hypothetical protein